MVIPDQLGRTVALDTPAKRIVSVVPSQTELLAHLGLDTEVVAVTKFCVHPDSLHREKPHVGGTKKLNLKRIRELSPDLILANKEENTRSELETLMAEFPVWVSDIIDVEGALEMIRAVGELTGTAQKAGETVRMITERFDQLSLSKDATRRPDVAYFIWREPWMVAGRDTFIDDMLTRAGFRNRFSHLSRYPEINPTDASGALILLSSEPFPFGEKHARELRAVMPDCEIRFVDGEMFSWYGSRLLYAPDYLRTLGESLRHRP